jgi:transcriptional regulator
MAMKKVDLLQGTLDLLILKSLTGGPIHGYRIAQKIRGLSDEVLKVEEGSLYPALYRLEQKDMIESEWGTSENNRQAKFYKLTKKGRREMDAEEASWARLSAAVTRVLKAIEQGA